MLELGTDTSAMSAVPRLPTDNSLPPPGTTNIGLLDLLGVVGELSLVD
jgi:hypothetical protein